MQTVVKYCKPEHHFSRTKTFKLGTLQYYREHENGFIADALEGITTTYTLEKIGTKTFMDVRSAEALSSGLLKFSGTGGGIIIGPDATLRINSRTQVPNQYIWCSSNQESGNKETADTLGYDSWYNIVDVEGFMQSVCYAMISKVKFKIPMIYSYKIDIVHGTVQYTSQKNLKKFNGYSNILRDSIFNKPETSLSYPEVDYTKNVEYRMLWMMTEPTTGLVHSVAREAIEFEFASEMKSFCK